MDADAKKELNTGFVQAAEIGDTDTVRQLLSLGADIEFRLPPSQGHDFDEGPINPPNRTALQAASDGIHGDVLRLLVNSGAEIDPIPQRRWGRTALQAAVELEDQSLVQLLLDRRADINGAPTDTCTLTALQGAAQKGNEELVQLLLDAMVTPLAPITKPHPGLALKSPHGRNILHISCQFGHLNLLRSLLAIATQDVLNARDHAGCTVLHVAAACRNVPCTELLMASGVDSEITDCLGDTALRHAMNHHYHEISSTLLKLGAKTDGLPFELLPAALRACGSARSHWRMVLLQSGPLKGTHLCYIDFLDMPIESIDDEIWTLRSFCFPERSRSLFTGSEPSFRDEIERVVIPSKYLSRYRVVPTSKTIVNWAWSMMDRDNNQGFVLGLPTSRDIQDTEKKQLFLVPYLCFHYPVHTQVDSTRVSQASIEHDDREFHPFLTYDRKVSISWIMRKETSATKGSPDRLRSINYRCSFYPPYLAIPADGAEFVGLFIDEIRLRWKELMQGAISHVGKIRTIQLNEGGKNSDVIKCLLTDSQAWQTLQNTLDDHALAIEGVIDTFRTNPIFHTEMMPENDETDPNRNTVPRVKLARLAGLLVALKDECAAGLLKLDSQTKEMIELEFNLVSIYEARRSIDMSTSMKRLSWITFIFLPLMFVSGLFGMNVNLLSDNPGWQWYLVVAIPFMALVVGIWVLCKYLYLPVLNFFARNGGQYWSVRGNDVENRQYRMLDITGDR